MWMKRSASTLIMLVAGIALTAGCGTGEDADGPDGPEGPPATEVEEAIQAPVVMVTGSTAGLGRALALRLASEGWHVIVHGRDEERAREVVEAIREEGTGSAAYYLADFASLGQVQELARRIEADYDRLDVLVNNAGIGPGAPGHERALSEDGHELRFQVNYLAGYLLTRSLLPLLEAGAPSRVVNVTSRQQQPLDFDDMRMDHGYTGSLAYGRSKLAQILHVVDLAEELAGMGIDAFAVHPAPAMDTDLVRETGGQPQTPVSRGVESVHRVVTEEGLPDGAFFFEQEEAQAHEQAYDAVARQRLRELSEAYVEEALGPGATDEGAAERHRTSGFVPAPQLAPAGPGLLF